MGPRMHALAMVDFGCMHEREGCGVLGPVARLPKKRRSAASWAVETAYVHGWRPDGDRRVGAAPRERRKRLPGATAREVVSGGLHRGGWQL